MSDIIVYSRKNCSFCDRAKALLKNRNLPHRIINIGTDVTTEEVRFMFPEAKTVPIVLINGKNIGGFTELQTWVDQNEVS